MPKFILESDVSRDERIATQITQPANQSIHQAVDEAEAPASDSDASSDGSDAPLPPKLSRSFGRTPSPEQPNPAPSPLTEEIMQQSLRSSFQSRALSASPQNITEQPPVHTAEDLVDIIHISGVCSYSGFNRGLFVSLTDLNEHGVPKTPPGQQLEPLPLELGVLQEQNTTHINSPDKSKAFIQLRSILG